MVELPFAPFFLRKLTTPGRGWVDTHHLSTLDPELYRHLLSLKNYEGSFEEMGLDFTTLSNEYGYSKVWMDRWINGLMNEWMHRWINGLMNEWMHRWINNKELTD